MAGVALFFVISLILPAIGDNKIKRIGVTGRFTPSTLPNEILSLVSEGLTKVTPEGDVEPSIAKSWETPDKGKTWVFNIDTTKTWQDGKKVDSSTINYQFSDLTIERPNDHTIIFKLQNPYSPFASVVSKPIFKKGLLGTGEYKVKKISVSGAYVSQLLLENSKKERIVYKFYASEDRLKLAFRLGEIDEIESIINLSPFDGWKNLNVTEKSDTGEYVALFYNTQDRYLSEKNLRQALSYAIDKDKLGGKRALSPISETSWAYNPQVKPYAYDPEKAKKTVSDLPKELSEGMVINLATSPLLLTQAEKIAKDWEAAGVKTNVQVYTVIPNDYQALLAIFDMPEDPDQYSVWHSTQTSTNITKYSSPRIDKLLEDGRTELNLEERKKIYLDFQRFLVEDSPASFLYYPTTYT
ncbi:MAG: ABC transporter substrate-binding protein, partial [Microgenomates group bacterium]